jgi:hypothetical protein
MRNKYHIAVLTRGPDVTTAMNANGSPTSEIKAASSVVSDLLKKQMCGLLKPGSTS